VLQVTGSAPPNAPILDLAQPQAMPVETAR
jgi:hypothetical protein